MGVYGNRTGIKDRRKEHMDFKPHLWFIFHRN
jgi:hypothetical protein